MLIQVYSATTEQTIASQLGLPEYSYYFVLKAFRPVLETLGEVVLVSDPFREVDPRFDACAARGEPCVFLSFSPPNKTPRGLRCPTIPVFAWEYDTIPDETWHGNPNEDWCEVLRGFGRALTHSSHTARVVRAQLGDGFDIAAIPAPVFDEAFRRIPVLGSLAASGPLVLARPGAFLDTSAPAFRRDYDFVNAVRRLPPDPDDGRGNRTWGERATVVKQHLGACYRELFRGLLPAPVARALAGTVRGISGPLRRLAAGRGQQLPEAPPERDGVALSGLVYTSIFNPADGRKNWQDAVLAFHAAFAQTEDATFVLKLTHRDAWGSLGDFARLLHKQRPFRCRFVVVAGYLDEGDYARLLAATTYVVNTSSGEGQCLPLMEYMSCGRPALAPDHTGMADYVHPGNAFVIGSSLEPCCWPHDLTYHFRARRHRVDWESIVTAFRQSARVHREEPDTYRRMSEASIAAQRASCSESGAAEALREFLSRDAGPR